MTDIEKSRLLFEALKREGECWHEPILYAKSATSNFPIWSCGCGKVWESGDCRWMKDVKEGTPLQLDSTNPNFFDPKDQAWQNFGWLWERAERVSFQYWLEDKEEHRIVRIVDCTALATALFEYLELNK